MTVTTTDQRRATFTRVKATPSEDGLLTFVGSTPTVDRVGDSIKPNWDLAAYKRNPVFLFQHDHGSLPIGRAEKVWQEGPNLKFSIRFVPADIYPLADTVRKMYEGGFMSAVSVGFKPTKMVMREGAQGFEGYDIEQSELLELSAVTIPCNPDALLEGKNVRPVFRKDKMFDARVEEWMKQADPVKVKAWLDEKTAMDEPLPSEDATPLDSAEEALAKGEGTTSMADLADLLEEADTACQAGEMDACSAAISAAKEMVASMGSGKAATPDTKGAAAAASATESTVPAASSQEPEPAPVTKGESILDSVESLERFIRSHLEKTNG